MAKHDDAAIEALTIRIAECLAAEAMYLAIIANVTAMEEDPRLFTQWQVKVITSASLWRHHYQEAIDDLETRRAKIQYRMRARHQLLREAIAKRAKLQAARRRAQEPKVTVRVRYQGYATPEPRLTGYPVTVQSSLAGANTPWQWSWGEGFVPFSDMLDIPGLSLFSSRSR